MSPTLPTSAAAGSPGVYWQGQDGNYYVKASGVNGVQNYGKSLNPLSPAYISSLTQIQDPSAPATGGGGGSSSGYGSGNTGSVSAGTTTGTQYQDKSNDIALQNAGLGQVDATANTGIGKVNDSLKTITGQYEDDLNTAKTEYGANSDSNQNDLQSNKQTSLQNAVQGRQGLYSTLASLGALNGTGLDLANNAVVKGANQDLTTAADTYATNQRGLDTSYNTYTTNTQRLEQKAKDTGANNIQQIQYDAAKSRMSYLTNLANDYTAEGNTGQAKTYTDQAAALAPTIASTNVPTIDLAHTGGAYSAPTLSQYVGQANNTTVKATPAAGGGILNIPGLLALNKRQTA